MKFRTPSDEVAFNAVLSAYEEEFGAENLVIVIPKHWTRHTDCSKFVPMSFRTWGEAMVSIRVIGYSAKYDQEI